ncbi:MAG: SixA phosphatase family protein, partial [Vicinamibacteria bacterium]
PDARAKLRVAAEGIARMGLRFDAIIASILPRSVETAEIFRQATSSACEVERSERLLPEASLEGVHELMNEEAAHASRQSAPAAAPLGAQILLVGHQPLIGRLAADLLGFSGATIPLRTGTLVRIEVDELPPSQPGRIRWLLPLDVMIRLG